MKVAVQLNGCSGERRRSEEVIYERRNLWFYLGETNRHGIGSVHRFTYSQVPDSPFLAGIIGISRAGIAIRTSLLQCLAQSHLSMLTGGARVWTNDLLVSGHPAPWPEPQPLQIQLLSYIWVLNLGIGSSDIGLIMSVELWWLIK